MMTEESDIMIGSLDSEISLEICDILESTNLEDNESIEEMYW